MKRGMIILIGAIVLVAIGYGLLSVMNRPLSKEVATEKIKKHLTKLIEKEDTLSSVLLTIYSEKNDYFEQFAIGTKNQASNQPVQIDSQYHSASIGKMMCAIIFGMLVDEGKINFNDNIQKWLDHDLLEGLFEIDGIDYRDQVTLKQLLTHTSGVNDYFEGPVKNGKPMLDIVSANPDLLFTPKDLIAFTRENQEPIGQPGQQFFYSDTGYILLGLILESIEGKPYSAILEERIFEPLGMNNSYLMFYNDEPADILGLYLNGIDYSERNALSIDWSGGGVITTMNDLLIVMKALENGDLLSEKVYGEMTDFSYRYEKGIYYGMGMMYFDFSELSFLLGSMSDVYGGVGSTGTYVLYDKVAETYYIANFGSLDYAQKSIQELVKIRMIYDRIVVE